MKAFSGEGGGIEKKKQMEKPFFSSATMSSTPSTFLHFPPLKLAKAEGLPELDSESVLSEAESPKSSLPPLLPSLYPGDLFLFSFQFSICHPLFFTFFVLCVPPTITTNRLFTSHLPCIHARAEHAKTKNGGALRGKDSPLPSPHPKSHALLFFPFFFFFFFLGLLFRARGR